MFINTQAKSEYYLRSVKRGGLITVLVAGLAAMACFGSHLFLPNKVMFGPYGDGLKNYYTPVWYLDHDSGVWFSGMNYPEGEHLIYTDGQPLLVWSLKLISPLTGPLGAYVPGILQLLMMLSVIGAAWFLFRILEHYRVSAVFAIVGAVLIAFGSPQIDRWHGHFALGYCLVVPWIWWWAIRTREGGWSRLLMLILLATAFGLIHLYYLLLAVLLLGTYAVVIAFDRNSRLTDSARMFVAAVLPLLIVSTFLIVTDPVDDRPASPYGFTIYKAELESVFLPRRGPVLQAAKKLIKLRKPQNEGVGYVGIPATLMVLWLLNRNLRRLRSSRRKRFWRSALPQDLGAWTITAWLVLLFAMAIPFRWGLDHLLDYIPPLKQFRSPGRAVWVFYYIWTVFTVVILHRGYRHWARRGSGRPALIGIALLGLTWAWEDHRWAGWVAAGNFEPNVMAEDRVLPALAESGLGADDFQAVLVMPWYHMGSEKLGITRGDRAMPHAFRISVETGLPIVNVMMSRTSLSQTLKSCRLVSPYSSNSEWLPAQDDRPYLAVHRGKLDPFERQLLNQADSLWHGDGITLFSVDASLFDRDPLNVRESGRRMSPVELRTDGPVRVFEDTLLCDRPAVFLVSAWFDSDRDHVSYPAILINWTIDGRKIQVRQDAKTSTHISDDGWVRASGLIDLPAGTTELQIELVGKGIRMRDGFIHKVPDSLAAQRPLILPQP